LEGVLGLENIVKTSPENYQTSFRKHVNKSLTCIPKTVTASAINVRESLSRAFCGVQNERLWA
jgi:hypothetical protein